MKADHRESARERLDRLDSRVDIVLAVLNELKTTQHTIKHHMHSHFKKLEVTAPQGMLIFTISKHGPMKISEISDHMKLSNSTVSGIVDRLEKIGYVERVRSSSDRRVVRVQVVEEVKAEVKKHDTMMENLLEGAMAKANDEELRQVLEGLTTLNELMIKYQKENEA